MYRSPVLIGVVGEALAGLLLWLSAGEWGGNWAAPWATPGATPGATEGFIFSAIVLHSISSYYLAGIFWQLLPRRYKVPARRSLSFLFVFLWILPVLGAIGILWSVTNALRRPRSRLSKNVKIVVLPELPFSPPAIFPVPPYSEGALRQIVHFAERPLKRLKAVMATRHMAPREAMMVWSKATRDPVDDVRLLAYAMRDDNEKRLTDRILALIEALPEAPIRLRNAYHKTIAALCWELVYHNLVQGAVRQHWLQTAQRHMQLVIAPLAHAASGATTGTAMPTVSAASAASIQSSVPAVSTDFTRVDTSSLPQAADPDSWLLYGRILLESGEYALARGAFISAGVNGIDEQQLLPWLAEIAFLERRFSEVKQHLSALERYGEKGRDLALVRTWWNK
jgi:hypothetical protein